VQRIKRTLRIQAIVTVGGRNADTYEDAVVRFGPNPYSPALRPRHTAREPVETTERVVRGNTAAGRASYASVARSSAHTVYAPLGRCRSVAFGGSEQLR